MRENMEYLQGPGAGDGSTRGRRARPSRRGSALVLALVVTSTMLTLGLAIAGVSVAGSRRVGTAIEDQEARVLAEAGLAESIVSRRLGGTGAIGSVGAPAFLGGGVVWVEVTDLGDGTTRLVANAMKDGGRAAVQAIVGRRSLWAGLQGISSLEAPITKTSAFLDSYDSREGSYASQVSGGHAGEDAVLQTNEDLSLASNTSIHGDARPGPGGMLAVGPGTLVTGSVTPLGSALELPDVEVPDVAIGGPLSVSGTSTLFPGTYGFSSLEIRRGASFTISGPATVVISGDLDLERADLIIDPSGGPVDIYLGGDLSTATWATIHTVGERPDQLRLYLTGDEDQRVDMHPHGEFHGTIYGPRAVLDLGTDLELFGAVAARRVELQPHATFHFDEALLDSDDGEQAPEEVLYWAPADLGSIPRAGFRGDPFVLLGVEPRDLPCPGACWEGVEHDRPDEEPGQEDPDPSWPDEEPTTPDAEPGDAVPPPEDPVVVEEPPPGPGNGNGNGNGNGKKK